MKKQATVIGAGIGGIATAIRLAIAGYRVQVFETSKAPGGKLAEFYSDGFRFDMGPSLFTLPEEVDALYQLAGEIPQTHFQYEKLPLVTRYFYEDQTVINAWANPSDFASEVETKTGEKAEKVLQFLQKSQELYRITEHVFLKKSLHKINTYLSQETLRSMLQVGKLDAFRTMHQANSHWFADSRVVRLFDRYATYNGSDPYQAPATLNIIPHLEHNLGAYFPTEGGMYGIVKGLVALAERLGVQFHYQSSVTKIIVKWRRAVGVKVGSETIDADVVVSNMDVVPTYRKLLPEATHPEFILKQPRSSSALIFYWGMNRTFPQLDLHNLLFSEQYTEEFQALFAHRQVFHDPTVYIYVSSKRNSSDAPSGNENWFVMMNAPPHQGNSWDSARIAQAKDAILQKIERTLGINISPHICHERTLTPADIEARTSSWQGALYGNSSNNRFAAFLRHPNFSRKIKNLYFSGGSVHPGGGIPLCLLSAKIIADLVQTTER